MTNDITFHFPQPTIQNTQLLKTKNRLSCYNLVTMQNSILASVPFASKSPQGLRVSGRKYSNALNKLVKSFVAITISHKNITPSPYSDVSKKRQRNLEQVTWQRRLPIITFLTHQTRMSSAI